MNLTAAAEELYGASPEEFVVRRTALVKQARADKDRDLATAVGALRRPTRSAWLVNLLAREAADDLAALFRLGAALREAQQQLDGPALRTLSQQRSRTVGGLARRASELAVAHGHQASEANRQEVVETLTAALADPELADVVGQGQIVQAVAYGGFGPVDLTGVAARPDLRATAAPARTGIAAAAGDAEDADDPTTAEREQARAEAEAALQQAQAELTEAQTNSEAATSAADELAEEVENLRTRLREAEAAERAARERARFARKKAQQLSQPVARAQAALGALRT